jgi:hypothetical protein
VIGTETALDGSLVTSLEKTPVRDREGFTFMQPRGVIEDAGLGNRISRLSVVNAIKIVDGVRDGTQGIGIRSASEPTVTEERGLSLWVDNCYFENNRVALLLHNAGAGMAGLTSTLVVERSLFKNNVRGSVNFNMLTSGSTVHATYRDNIFIGGAQSNIGLQIGGGSYGSDDTQMFILSSGNVFEDFTVNNPQSGGMVIVNGWHGDGANPASDRNWVSVRSQSDTFRKNRWGILVNQAFTNLPSLQDRRMAFPGNDNTTRLQVLGGSFEENTTHNIEIFNPRDTRSPADKAAQGVPRGNVVELLLRNTTTVGLSTFMLRAPGDPSNRNIVIGSDVALAHSNDDVTIDGSFTWTGED